jgi:phenylacetate-CoA ligase
MDKPIQKLARAVDFAKKNTVYYQKLFKQPKLKGLKIKTYEDFLKIPITPSRVFRNRPFDFLIGDPKDLQFITSTSGSTGKPKISFNTGAFDLFNTRLQNEAMAISNQDFCALIEHGTSPLNVSLPPRLRALGIKVIQIQPGLAQTDPDFLFELLRKTGATIIRGQPGLIFRLTRTIQNKKSLLKGIKVKKILLSGSALTQNIRRFINETWQAEVFNIYGCNELGLVGYECRAHQGLHLYEERLFVEIAHPSSNRILPQGEVGKLLMTSLKQRDLCLLRYEIGDLAKIYTDQCACNKKGLKILPCGRMGEYIKLGRKGKIKIFPYQIYNLLAPYSFLSGRFEFTITNDSQKRERLSLKLELLKERKMTRKSISKLSQAFKDKIPGLQEEIKSKFLKFSLKFSPPDSLLEEWGRKPQSMVIDQRKK